MKGIIYGIGVGPGDPELLTLKAVRLIREADVIAVPGDVAEESVAYRIALGAVPELEDKEIIALPMPMSMDMDEWRRAHKDAAEKMEAIADQGRSVAFLTLGDVVVYCTFSYIQKYLEKDGYEVKLVNGITSFCAAGAALNISLSERNEMLHIVPGAYKTLENFDQPGNYIIMKSGSHMAEVKDMLRQSDLTVRCVENCSMENERCYSSLEEIPDDAGYFSLIVAKREKK
ncbi:MAG: precorrin-2 C(20)-methyltransferase [Lachnospiraceae bacterium]|nr:precorrin-2 C(20)-methyltransferase [Candidatus Equihabitans merdae]